MPSGTLFSEPGRGVRGILLRLAWPVVAERVALTMLAAADALLVGRYVGAAGVAAVGLGAMLLWVPQAGLMGVEVGATALVARDVGSGDRVRVRRSTEAAVACALGWGLLMAALMVGCAPWLMRAMGAEPDVAPLGTRYLRLAGLGLPFLLLMTAANGALRGAGDTRRPMAVLLVLNAVNLLVTFALISGVFGVELGVAASGTGYAVACTTGGLLAMGLLVAGKGVVRYRIVSASLRPGWAALRRFLGLAVPSAIEEFQFILAFLVYTRIIAGAGTAAVAAHTIALRAQEVALVPTFALGTAVTALVGQAMGMRRPDLAAASAKAAFAVGLTIMLTLGGAVAVFAPALARLFVDDADTVATAATLMRIFVLAYPMLAVVGTLTGALRGAGDVRYVLAISSATTWGVRVPVAWLLAVPLGLGAPGAWCGAVLDNSLRGALALARFASGRWKHLA